MNLSELDSQSGRPRPSRHKARRLALQALYQWLIADTEVDDLLDQFVRLRNVRGADWKYAEDLVRGATGHHDELDSRITPHLDRPLVQIDPVEHAVLLLGAFELIHQSDLPYRAAINEGVNLAKAFGATDSYKYINGILDRLARELQEQQSGTS